MTASIPSPAPLYLQSDTKTPLSVSYLAGSSSAPLVVFLTGLARPAAAFDASVTQLLALTAKSGHQPGILVWDRYGQGLSGKQEKTHDAADVVNTLRELLTHLLRADLDRRPMIFVANSIGCTVARLYAAQHPTVDGFIFLDSMIAHTDFVSIFAPERTPAEECGELERVRRITAKIFHPSVPNPEGFNRLALNSLVPHSNKPALPGQPWVTVIGHDPVVFAKDSEEKMGIPVWATNKYLDVEWSKYNHGLTELTTPSKAKGPIIATGADHFIQIGRPDLVAEEVFDMLQKVQSASS